MQKIIPSLWFDKNAEEAANFYVETFGDGKILSTTKYPDAGKEIHGMDPGTVLTVEFEIRGYKFVALNGGPAFRLNPSISFTVNCASKEEVDHLYGKLIKGGKALMPLDTYPFNERYGWVEDKFGLSWQIILREPKDEKIFPSLMYTQEMSTKAEEAIHFYTSIFPNSRVGEINKYGENSFGENPENVSYGEFYLNGDKLSAMGSSISHQFKFNEAISLMVNCKDQEEIDYHWDKLSHDPKSEQCGWLKDKYGVSWQIVPEGMDEFLNSSDPEKAKRGMEAFLQMKKIDIKALNEAIG